MILDSKEFYAPIITPYEAQLAFLPEGADMDGSFRLDFDSLLEQQQKVWLIPKRYTERSWHALCLTCSDVDLLHRALQLTDGLMRSYELAAFPTGSCDIAASSH